MFPTKPSNASVCAVERRQREDSAPRINEMFPQLSALSIHVDEHSSVLSPRYVRRVVIQNAPALFILPCSDPNCSDGGHDISSDIIGQVRSKRREFDGSHVCGGWIGSRQCGRTIWFHCEASYSAA
jgi:hypothetical protein